MLVAASSGHTVRVFTLLTLGNTSISGRKSVETGLQIELHVKIVRRTIDL